MDLKGGLVKIMFWSCENHPSLLQKLTKCFVIFTELH